jgi:hypothetical protein
MYLNVCDVRTENFGRGGSSSQLKGRCHEIFHICSFRQAAPPGSNRHAQKQFRFFLNTREDI